MSLAERLANVERLRTERRKRNMQKTLAELKSAKAIVREYRERNSEHGSIFAFLFGLREFFKH